MVDAPDAPGRVAASVSRYWTIRDWRAMRETDRFIRDRQRQQLAQKAAAGGAPTTEPPASAPPEG
jgi:hypothetical protein